MSRILALVLGCVVLALCAAIPSISFADQGDEPTLTPTVEPTAPTATPEQSTEGDPAAPATPAPDGISAQRAAPPTTLTNAGTLAVQYRAFVPLVIGGSGVTSASAPSFEEQVVALVNQERQIAGCAPLHITPELSTAALEHSDDMANRDYFSHTGSDGSLPWDRMDRAGYNWTSAAENIAAGAHTPDEVVTLWMNSPGHRANILDCSKQDTGLGYVNLANDTGSINYHTYWTQVFGTR